MLKYKTLFVNVVQTFRGDSNENGHQMFAVPTSIRADRWVFQRTCEKKLIQIFEHKVKMQKSADKLDKFTVRLLA